MREREHKRYRERTTEREMNGTNRTSNQSIVRVNIWTFLYYLLFPWLDLVNKWAHDEKSVFGQKKVSEIWHNCSRIWRHWLYVGKDRKFLAYAMARFRCIIWGAKWASFHKFASIRKKIIFKCWLFVCQFKWKSNKLNIVYYLGN